MKKKMFVMVFLMMLLTSGLVFAGDVTVSGTQATTWDGLEATAFTWLGRIYNVLVLWVIYKGSKRVLNLVGEFQDQESDEQGTKQQKKIIGRIGLTVAFIIATPLLKFLIIDIAKDFGVTMNLVW